MITDEQALVAVDLAVARGDAAALDRIAVLLDAEDLRDVSLPVAAIAYAERGIPMFPLRPGDKKPAIASAHRKDDPLRYTCKGTCGRPGHGLYDATADPAQVHTWWAQNAAYNIGFPTGHLFDVIDVDGPPGYASLRQLEDAGAVPPILASVSTARGGRHLYIAPTGDGNAAGVLTGIDYRGAGGYVVAPPSYSAKNKHHWTWIDPWCP